MIIPIFIIQWLKYETYWKTYWKWTTTSFWRVQTVLSSPLRPLTHTRGNSMLVFHFPCLIFLTHAISVKRWWHRTEIEQMRRQKHHLGTMHISNRQQLLITCCSLDWHSTNPQPPAPDFIWRAWYATAVCHLEKWAQIWVRWLRWMKPPTLALSNQYAMVLLRS